MKSLEETLRENKERIYAERRAEIARQNKKNKKELILFIFITIAIVAGVFKIVSDMDKQLLNDCTQKGHSERYCMKNVVGI